MKYEKQEDQKKKSEKNIITMLEKKGTERKWKMIAIVIKMKTGEKTKLMVAIK
jgi:hypothetical protein